MNRLEQWLEQNIAYVDILNSDKSLYLRRYFLFGGNKGGSSVNKEQKPIAAETKDGFKILLHIFHSSDEGECLHDHPWDFVSIILAGAYKEITEHQFGVNGDNTPKIIKVCHSKYPGMILARKAEHRHRVELYNKIIRKEIDVFGAVPGFDYTVVKKKCWSLVFRGPRKRAWGFWNKGKFTNWMRWKQGMCDE